MLCGSYCRRPLCPSAAKEGSPRKVLSVTFTRSPPFSRPASPSLALSLLLFFSSTSSSSSSSSSCSGNNLSRALGGDNTRVRRRHGTQLQTFERQRQAVFQGITRPCMVRCHDLRSTKGSSQYWQEPISVLLWISIQRSFLYLFSN